MTTEHRPSTHAPAVDASPDIRSAITSLEALLNTPTKADIGITDDTDHPGAKELQQIDLARKRRERSNQILTLRALRAVVSLDGELPTNTIEVQSKTPTREDTLAEEFRNRCLTAINSILYQHNLGVDLTNPVESTDTPNSIRFTVAIGQSETMY